MKICILIADSNGAYPVPAVNGGAVQSLVEQLLKTNEISKCAEFEIVTFYEKRAFLESLNFSHTKFHWIRVPAFVKFLDKIIYKLVNIFFKNKKAISFRTIASLFFYIICSTQILKHSEFDKVIIENNIPLAWTIKLSNYQKDFYYHLHNIPRVNCGCKDVFERCSGFLCVSKFVANRITCSESVIGTIPNEKIRILYNCVDTNIFHPLDKDTVNEEKKKYGISINERIILFAGRLSKEKGIDIFLKSLANIHEDNLRVVIVGSVMHGNNSNDSFYPELRESVELIDVPIIFTGYVQYTEMSLLYNMADIVVLPSMWDEPAGLTMLEALLCGTPLISTVSGGIPEYVGKYASLINRDSKIVENMKNEILKHLSNLKRLETETIYEIRHSFSSETYALRFSKVIN